MKIAIILRKLNVKGGTQRQALSLAHELKKSGHQVTIYALLYDKKSSYEDLLNQLEVVFLDTFDNASFLASMFSKIPFGICAYLSAYLLHNAMAKELAMRIAEDTDVLNPHDHVAYRVAAYFKKYVKNIPSVWMMNDMPTRAWAYWRDSQFGASEVSRIKKIGYWIFDWWEITHFIQPQDSIVVLDNRDKDWVKEYFKKDAHVIRSGLDIEKFRYVQRLPLASKKARLLATGIFFAHRCFEDVVFAMEILLREGYDLSFSIVGDMSADRKYAEKIMRIVKDKKLEDRVHFLGAVSDEELLRCYREHDILLFPNHLQSWGLTVFEAMASGMPVIVSKGAGAHEVLNNRKNALLFPPRDIDVLVSSIRELINNNELYLALSRNGRAFVESNISWSRYAREILSVFDKARNL